MEIEIFPLLNFEKDGATSSILKIGCFYILLGNFNKVRLWNK